MIERRTITFPYRELAGLELPAFEARGAREGPKLTLIGGVHGCEYSSIAAVIAFMRELDTRELAGTVTAVPVVNLDAFRQRSPFVVPADGKNLNRCFPGRPDGTHADVLAHAVFERLIAPADLLIDLHGGDLVEALEPFAIYDESDVEDRSRGIAIAFGLRYVVRNRRQGGGPGGMTSTAAAQAGIPAVIAEAGDRGQLQPAAVRTLVEGTRNALRHLDLLPGPPRPPVTGMQAVGESIWLRSRARGWWEPAVVPGEEIRAGEPLGVVRDLWGDPHEEVQAPADGVVLFTTTSPAVAADGLLLGLGTELAPLAP